MENKTSNVKSDQVKKSYSRLRTVFIVTTSVLGVASVTFASLFIWKLLSKNNPVVPDEVQYMENFTNEKYYMKTNAGYELSTEKTREYNENWQVKKETIASYSSGESLAIRVTENEYDKNYLLVKKTRNSLNRRRQTF